MRILLVAADESETEFLRESLNNGFTGNTPDFLHTGIGMVAMTYALTRHLSEYRYDLVVNIGVAGAIDPDLQLGTVVAISEDHFYELGAQDGDRFLTFAEIGLPVQDRIVPENYFLPAQLKFPSVAAVTVNTVHGEEKAIETLRTRSAAAVESMEGAAFYYVCNGFGLRCLQLRAVSNRVERRNRDAWDLPLAVSRLSEAVLQVLQIANTHA
jgi:futalosine hydrolase